MVKKRDIEELKNNADFMRRKLEESRKAMEEMPIIMPYDNGGGQTGIRENPVFPAYEKLLKSYQATLTQLETMAGKEEQTPKEMAKIVGISRWRKDA